MATTMTDPVRRGQPLPALTKQIDQRRIDVYSGVKPNSKSAGATSWGRKPNRKGSP